MVLRRNSTASCNSVVWFIATNCYLNCSSSVEITHGCFFSSLPTVVIRPIYLLWHPFSFYSRKARAWSENFNYVNDCCGSRDNHCWPLSWFSSKAKVFQSVSFLFYFTGIYVRTEWVTVSNFNTVCFQIYVISSIGCITSLQWPALQLAWLA